MLKIPMVNLEKIRIWRINKVKSKIKIQITLMIKIILLLMRGNKKVLRRENQKIEIKISNHQKKSK